MYLVNIRDFGHSNEQTPLMLIDDTCFGALVSICTIAPGFQEISELLEWVTPCEDQLPHHVKTSWPLEEKGEEEKRDSNILYKGELKSIKDPSEFRFFFFFLE
ncbi:hypothetical protein ACS0TY_019859 [Phlomoides rotata]